MAVSALAVAFIFAFTVNGVRGCDPNYCCCPNGEINAVNLGTLVGFRFSPASGPGCPQSLVTSTCEVSNNVCSTTSLSGDFNFAATKNGGAVSVTDRNDARCSMNLQCLTGTPICETTSTWTGKYTVVSGSKGVVSGSKGVVSGSKGVVVSVTCLLIATLSGILI